MWPILLATLNFRTGLTATAVTSSCSFNTNTGTLTGTAAITNGRVTVGGVPTTPLAASPFPNMALNLPGIATVIMNRQTRAGDGTLTVNAIYVSWLGSTQTLAIGTSVCNAANLVPVPALAREVTGDHPRRPGCAASARRRGLPHEPPPEVGER